MRLLPRASRNAMFVWPHRPKITSTPSRSRYSASRYDEIRVAVPAVVAAAVVATVLMSTPNEFRRDPVDQARLTARRRRAPWSWRRRPYRWMSTAIRLARDYPLPLGAWRRCYRNATVTTILLVGQSARVRCRT